LSEKGFPFVAFGRSDLDFDFPYVDEDSYQGIKTLTQHMIDLGHRRIALISAPPDLMFSRFRSRGYFEALQENNIPVDETLIVTGDLTQRGGYQAAQQIIGLNNRPTAIVACNDLMALGTMSAIQNEGMVVGKDISVGGFDDIASAEHAHPPLTTIRQPLYEIGQRITEMLIQLLQDKEPKVRQVMLLPELVVRSSSGPL
jgi:LacI family transcriptional regulator